MKQKVACLLSLVAALWAFGFASDAAAKTVVIDAGHGGIDRGGIPYQRYPEKVVALQIAELLEGKLRAAGYRTVMTRSGDYFVGLRERCNTANAQQDAIFVSIHTNSDPRGTGIGIETYYYARSGARLAAAIQRQVVRAAGTPDRRVRTRPLFVLRNNRLAAVLVEVGFLTNAIEGPRLANSESYRDQLAAAIARGIESVF
jgi:N-acetylmuramoyl-L-alanine amidase